MLGNISVMHAFSSHQHGLRYHPMTCVKPFLKLKRPSRSRQLHVAAVFQHLPASVATSCIACGSKAVSFVFTYPIESCKIYTQMGKTWCHPYELYKGFGSFMIIAVFQSFLSYNVFFAILDALNPYFQRHVAYMYASVLSSFITSFIKVPLTFVSRNIIFVKSLKGWKALSHVLSQLSPEIFQKGWVTTMLSDVPDSFVKFFLNSYIQTYLPVVDVFQRSCITGVVTSLVNAPLDYLVTRTMCQAIPTNHLQSVSMCWSGIQYRVMSCMVGNIIFFNIFNLLTPMAVAI